MAQRPKDHVRQAILDAARSELAAHGLAGMTLATVAARAGTSVGNVYKYFPGKDELFQAAIPTDLVRELEAKLEERVHALGANRDVDRLAADHPYRAASSDVVTFALAHRDAVLFLLGRSGGSPHAAFADRVAGRLTKLAITYAEGAYPAAMLGAGKRRALLRIYGGFVSQIEAILRDEHSELSVRAALEHLSDYHLAGLRAFFRAAERDTDQRRGPSK